MCLKSIDEAEARRPLDEILDETQRQSIVIRRQGREIAIVLSVAECERLHVAAVGELLAPRSSTRRIAGRSNSSNGSRSQLFPSLRKRTLRLSRQVLRRRIVRIGGAARI